MNIFRFLLVIINLLLLVIACTNNSLPNSDLDSKPTHVTVATKPTVEYAKNTRGALFEKKKQLLEDIIDGLDASQDIKLLKKNTFEIALDNYKKMINKNKNFSYETIEIIKDNSMAEKAVTDINIENIFDTRITTTDDWMHYHIAYVSADNPTAVITYVDFANASLGGGAFGGGWVQEEQMVAFCTDLALLLAGRPYLKNDDELKMAPDEFITRITRETHPLSPRPTYFKNIRCGTGTALGTTVWHNISELTHADNPPLINILAVAAVMVRNHGQVAYSLEDIIDFFSNIYRGFELVKNSNKDQKNIIISGRLGAGVFGHSVYMSAALQMLAARIIGIDELVLTQRPGGRGDDTEADIYDTPKKTVEDFITHNNLKDMKIKAMLELFLDKIKDDPRWQKNSRHK